MQNIPQNIEQFLRQKQFGLKHATNNDRFILLTGNIPEHEGQVILKICLGQKHSLAQRNLSVWTQQLQATIPPGSNFAVAPVIDHGFIDQEQHWIMMPYIEGVHFATMHGGHSITSLAQPEKYFDAIAQMINHIKATNIYALEGIDLRCGKVPRRDKLALLENIIGWSRPDTPYLSELLQIISKNYTNLRPAPAHGDLSETNIIIDQLDRPTLFDAELGSGQHYMYYDVAEFYNRLFTRLYRPDLAHAFLKVYIKTLDPAEQTTFLNNFLCLCAQRCVGNFFEIQGLSEGKQKRSQAALQFAEDIVNYRIIQNL